MGVDDLHLNKADEAISTRAFPLFMIPDFPIPDSATQTVRELGRRPFPLMPETSENPLHALAAFARTTAMAIFVAPSSDAKR